MNAGGRNDKTVAWIAQRIAHGRDLGGYVQIYRNYPKSGVNGKCAQYLLNRAPQAGSREGPLFQRES